MSSGLSAILIAPLTGCGTLLHGERKGQTGGRLDAGIVILDGLGLLVFLIPGIIAFAVDFSNGTIYLPPEKITRVQQQDLRQVKFDPQHATCASIEKIIEEETGQTVRLQQDNIKIVKVTSVDEISQTMNE